MKRVWLIVGLVAALSGCGRAGPVATERGPVSITVAVVAPSWLPDRAGEYEQLAQAFHEANPNVTVQVKPVALEDLPPELGGASLLTDPQWGVDLIVTSGELVPALVQARVVRDLQPLLDAGQIGQANDWLPAALNLVKWEGHVYALPWEVDPWVMFYNRDRFDAAGLPYPAAGWHWAEFLEAARAVSGSSSAGIGFGSWGAQVAPFIYQNGGTVVDDPLAPRAATLKAPATVEAIRWYVDLALVEQVMPTPAELVGYAQRSGRRETVMMSDAAREAAAQAQADLEQAVANGDVAMWMGSLSDRGGHWQGWGFSWGVAPLPAGRQAATLAGAWGCLVTAQASDPDEALKWAEYLTQQPPLYGGLPARRSAARADATRVQLGAEVAQGLDGLMASLEEGRTVPVWLDGMAAEWLQGPLFAVLEGKSTLDGALEAAQQTAEAGMGPR